MKVRKVVTSFGDAFDVPSNIVRLDGKNTHGWQVRFGRWAYFPDQTKDGSGAGEALRLATEELRERMLRLPAPTGLRTDPNRNKTTDLPVGVSGPTQRIRKGRNTVQYYFQVTFPVTGGKPANRSIYIATENTMTQELYDRALMKAITLRDEGVRRFQAAATLAQKAAAKV